MNCRPETITSPRPKFDISLELACIRADLASLEAMAEAEITAEFSVAASAHAITLRLFALCKGNRGIDAAQKLKIKAAIKESKILPDLKSLSEKC